MEEKVNEWQKAKAAQEREKRELRQEHDDIELEKAKWKENLNYLKSNHFADADARRKLLVERKREIDLRINAMNKRIQAHEQTAKALKATETELKPYLERRAGKENYRQVGNTGKRAGAHTDVNFYPISAEFEDVHSLGCSSDHETKQ
jgi:hypothetical protein